MEPQGSTKRRSLLQLGCYGAIGLLLLAIMAAALWPVFAKAREKARSTAMGGGEMMAAAPSAPPPPSEADAARLPGAASSVSWSAAEAAARRQMVYSGDMTLEVDNVDAARAAAEKIVTAAGGRVSQEDREEYEAAQPRCLMTLRFPARQFTAVCDAIRKLGEVRHEKRQSEDVTKEFVDLEARLKVLNQEESTLAGMFARQGRLSDVLAVEQQLSRVRTEIEQLQGQLRYLRDQVAESTLTVTLYTKHAEAVRKLDKWDLGYHVLRAWRALVSVARALTYLVIYSVIVVGPFVLLAWLAWMLLRGARRRRPPQPNLPPREGQ